MQKRKPKGRQKNEQTVKIQTHDSRAWLKVYTAGEMVLDHVARQVRQQLFAAKGSAPDEFIVKLPADAVVTWFSEGFKAATSLVNSWGNEKPRRKVARLATRRSDR